MCAKAERLLESLAVTQFKIDQVSCTKDGAFSIIKKNNTYFQKFLPDATETGLSEIVNANITQVLAASNNQFEQLESRIQHEIDKETYCKTITLEMLYIHIYF